MLCLTSIARGLVVRFTQYFDQLYMDLSSSHLTDPIEEIDDDSAEISLPPLDKVQEMVAYMSSGIVLISC